MKKLQKVNITYKVDRIDDRKLSLLNMVYIFVICAMLGWGFEVIFCYFKFGYIMNRGMLYGPFCSIYGFGGLILYILFYNVKGARNNIPYTFITSATVLGAFELVSGLILTYIFNAEMWNYDGEFLEILNYTTVPILIGWGILGTLYIYLIQPLLLKIISLIPLGLVKRLAIIIICLYVIDFGISTLHINLNPEILYKMANPDI